MNIMILRIKELCDKNDLSLSELAKKINIARETLSRGERWNPSLKTIESIAKALNVSVIDLFVDQSQTQGDTKITGAVRVGDHAYLINSIQDLQNLLEQLKGSGQE